MIDRAITGPRRLRPDEPVPMADAVQLGKRGAPVGNQNAAKEKSENKGDNVTFERGNSAAYTLARLDRDRPDMTAQVRAKELSPNAAVVETGFRK